MASRSVAPHKSRRNWLRWMSCAGRLTHVDVFRREHLLDLPINVVLICVYEEDQLLSRISPALQCSPQILPESGDGGLTVLFYLQDLTVLVVYRPFILSRRAIRVVCEDNSEHMVILSLKPHPCPPSHPSFILAYFRHSSCKLPISHCPSPSPLSFSDLHLIFIMGGYRSHYQIRLHNCFQFARSWHSVPV